jgi:GLPGLI family protein
MKKIIFIVSICFVNIAFSQNKIDKISYNYFVNGSKIQYELVVTDSISKFIFVNNTNVNNASNTIVQSDDSEYIFYKDLINEKICYNETFFPPAISVVDSLNSMKWDLVEEDKKILNYKCSAAKTLFRGRAYTAYYAPDIPLNNGPWKFGGLPGLILEVSSGDGEYKYIATAVTLSVEEKITKYNTLFRNYVKKNKFEVWNAFVGIFKTRLDNKLKRLKAEETEDEKGFPNYFRVNRPEIIYKKAQEGIGIEY